MPKHSNLKQSWPLVLITVAAASGLFLFEQQLKDEAETTSSKLAVIAGEDSAYTSDLNELDEEEHVDREIRFLSHALDGDRSQTGVHERTREAASELFHQAVALAKQGKVDQAIERYRSVIAIKPNHQMAGINMAILQQRQHQWDESLLTLERVLGVAGGSRKGKIYALMGRALEQQDEWLDAAIYFRKSIDYRPTHVLTWRRLAQVSAMSQLLSASERQSVLPDYANVADLMGKVVALDAQNARSFLDQAYYQFTRLDFDGAISTLENTGKALFSESQALLRDQILLQAYFERGRISKIKKLLVLRHKSKALADQTLLKVFSKISHKQYGAALKLWRKHISEAELKEETIEAQLDHLLLARLYHESEQFDQAEMTLRALLSQPEMRGLAVYKRAQIHAKSVDRGSLELAHSLFKGLLEPIYYPADIAREISKTAMRLDYADESLLYAALAHKQGGDKRRFEFQRVQAERQYGSIMNAVKMAAKLSQRYPKSRRVLRLWADSLLDAGQIDQAIEKYRELTKNNQRRSDLHTLAKLLASQQRLDESANVLESLLEKYSDDIDARYLLAANLCRNEQMSECKLQANRVLRLDSQHSGAKALIAQLSSNKNHG